MDVYPGLMLPQRGNTQTEPYGLDPPVEAGPDATYASQRVARNGALSYDSVGLSS